MSRHVSTILIKALGQDLKTHLISELEIRVTPGECLPGQTDMSSTSHRNHDYRVPEGPKWVCKCQRSKCTRTENPTKYLCLAGTILIGCPSLKACGDGQGPLTSTSFVLACSMLQGKSISPGPIEESIFLHREIA